MRDWAAIEGVGPCFIAAGVSKMGVSGAGRAGFGDRAFWPTGSFAYSARTKMSKWGCGWQWRRFLEKCLRWRPWTVVRALPPGTATAGGEGWMTKERRSFARHGGVSDGIPTSRTTAAFRRDVAWRWVSGALLAASWIKIYVGRRQHNRHGWLEERCLRCRTK